MFFSIRYRVSQYRWYCSPFESLYECLCVHVSSQQNVVLETSSSCSGKYIKGGFEHFCGCLPDSWTLCGHILEKQNYSIRAIGCCSRVKDHCQLKTHMNVYLKLHHA